MGCDDAWNWYAVKTGTAAAADHSTRTAVVAAVAGQALSLKSMTLGSDAANSISITDEDGNALVPAVPLIYMEANTTIQLNWNPGAHVAISGKGISITSSAVDLTSAYGEAGYV